MACASVYESAKSWELAMMKSININLADW